MLLLFKHCLSSKYYQECRLQILDALADYCDEGENQWIVEELRSTPLS